MNPANPPSPVGFRRRAILNRIHSALDAFYLLQRIDWEYDGRTTLDKILALALEELEFEGGKRIERALLIVQQIVQRADGSEVSSAGSLEVEAGWRAGDEERAFSRTVVQQTMQKGEPILCENAKDDPRFMAAESIKGLQTLSLISMPLLFGEKAMGAIYIESGSPGNIFSPEDMEFLAQFAGAIAPYVKTALTHQGHIREIRTLRAAVEDRYSFANIIGRSAAIRGVFELMKIAAGNDRTVLITGESGCGKEMVARSIHHHSARAKAQLVTVDCSGLSEHLLESELFGHRKGAFTGANSDKVGAFEEADGGTIFLDEVSDAPRPLQQKLRRVLQEGEIRRVGDSQFLKVDVRVICATNRSLPEMVEKGEFIRDLFFRINKFPIHIPPLRERREDIPPLVHHFFAQAAAPATEGRPKIEGISPEALEILMGRDWAANNIRELRNAVELAVDLASGPLIDARTIEKVDRVQRGESSGALEVEPAARGVPSEDEGLVQVNRGAVRRLLEAGTADGTAGAAPPGGDREAVGPFYRIYEEFAARAIIEGLRVTRWKLRPAAKLLGISPMKLRGELKGFISATLARFGGDMSRAALDLDIPADVLAKKVAGLRLHGGGGPDGGGSEEE